MNNINISDLVEEYRHDSKEWKYYEKKALKQLCCILAYQKDGERYKYPKFFKKYTLRQKIVERVQEKRK